MSEDLLLRNFLQQEFSLEYSQGQSLEALQEALAMHINHLIHHDFQQLLVSLYRIDIDESRLKSLLAENPELNAGSLIAALIVERQLQKIKTRQQFKKNEDIPDAEKW
jgi:hypothetical protein